MLSFHKNLSALMALALVFFLTACGGINREERQAWFANYFATAAKDENLSHRIFCLWFGGSRQAYTDNIIIGGNKKEANIWFDGVEDMLLGYNQAEVKPKFVFEIVSDQKTYKSHEAKINNFKQRFPNNFKHSLLDDLDDQYKPPLEVLEHATDGNPAFASDALRLFYLPHKDFKLNVYMDVDAFNDKISHLTRYNHYKIFGTEVRDNGVFISKNANDYLVERNLNSTDWQKLKDLAFNNYLANKELIDHQKDRARFKGSPNFLEYEEKINKLVKLQLEHPKTQIEIVTAIIQSYGPSLWVSAAYGLVPSVKTNQWINDEVVSAQAWKGGGGIPLGLKLSSASMLDELDIIKDLSAFLDQNTLQEVKESILKLNLMGWDYNYFKNFKDHDLGLKIQEEIKEQWTKIENYLHRYLAKIIITIGIEKLKVSSSGVFMALETLQ